MAAITFHKEKVTASSILEVVISMVIILVVFGIAMMIFTNVTNMSLSAKKIRAEGIVRKTLLLAEQTDQPESQSLQDDGFRVEVTVKLYRENNALYNVNIVAYDENQQQIASVHQLIPNKHD